MGRHPGTVLVSALRRYDASVSITKAKSSITRKLKKVNAASIQKFHCASMSLVVMLLPVAGQFPEVTAAAVVAAVVVPVVVAVAVLGVVRAETVGLMTVDMVDVTAPREKCSARKDPRDE